MAIATLRPAVLTVAALVVVFAVCDARTVRIADDGNAPFNDPLADLLARVFPAGAAQVTIDATTLGDATQASLLTNGTGLPTLTLCADSGGNPPKCTLDLLSSPQAVVCTGVFNGFGGNGTATVVFANLATVPHDGNGISLGVAVIVDVTRGWNPRTNVPSLVESPGPSWLASTAFTGSEGNITLATADFVVPHSGVPVSQGTLIMLEHVTVTTGASLLSLEKLNPLVANTTLSAIIQFPLGTHSGSGLRATLALDVAIALPQGSGLVSETLAVDVDGVGVAPSVTLSSALRLSPRQGGPVTFLAQGVWVSSAPTNVALTGSLDQPWVQPLGLKFLSVDKATANAQLVLGASEADGVSVPQFTVDADAAWGFASPPIVSSLHAHATNNFFDLDATSVVAFSSPAQALRAILDVPSTEAVSLDGVRSVNTTLALTISTYTQAPLMRGLTFSTDVALIGDLVSLMTPLFGAQAPTVTLDLVVFVPVFDSLRLDSSTVTFSSPSLPIGPTASLTGLVLAVSAGPATNVSLASGLTIALSNNPPLVWGVAVDWSSGSQELRLAGGLLSAWPKPFGVSWLNVDAAAVAATVSAGPRLTALAIQCAANITFADAGTVDVSLVAADNMKDIAFTADVSVHALAGAVKAVLGLPTTSPSAVDDVRLDTATVTLTVATYSDADHRRGLALTTQGAAIDSGSPLHKHVAALQKADSVTWAFELFVPVFDKVPKDVQFALTTSAIPIAANMTFDGVYLAVSVGAPIVVTAEAGISILFHKQPDWLDFKVQGSFAADGSLSIAGALVGTWDNVFGVKGLSISDAWIDVGAGVTGLTAFGLGTNLTFGRVELALDGYVDILEPTRLFLLADLEDPLTMQDVVVAWDATVPAGQPIVAPSAVPLLKFNEVRFSLAPEGGQVPVHAVPVYFKPGVNLNATVTLIGVDECHVEVDTVFSDSGIPDFLFSIDMSFNSSFAETWRHWMGAMFTHDEFETPEIFARAWTPDAVEAYAYNLSWVFPQLKKMDLDDVSLLHIAHADAPPSLDLGFIYKGQYHEFRVNLTLPSLASGIHDLIKDGVIALKELLHVPGCVIDLDCPTGQYCAHGDSNWHCAPTCPPGSGKVDLFGCVPCVTEAECSFPGSAGPCCMHGTCTNAKTEGDFCGMCSKHRACNDPMSGCILGRCRKCLTSLDCHWKGSAGDKCHNGLCVPK